MPGIVGLITKIPCESATADLRRMIETVCHQQFYQKGTWIDERCGVYVGWTALDRSVGAMDPISDGRQKTLVFSGEEYSEDGSWRCSETGGAARLLVECTEYESSTLSKLNGRFHGLLIDRLQGRVLLFNDRYGMHRLYYHESKEGFYFATEAKAILAVRPDLRRMDIRSLGEVVTCGCVLDDRTLFEEIGVLPPASAWEFRCGKAERKRTYFDPREWEEQDALDSESYYREIRANFSRVLPRYLRGQERIGVALTGGLDTRAIMAWLKLEPKSLPCYTFGGTLRECQDVQIARKVAKELGQPYEVITVGDEFLSRFSHYAERSIYLTEGGTDVSRSSDLYLSERARAIAPVKIVGTYGSEILQRAVMFRPQSTLSALYQQEFLFHVREAAETYARARRTHPVTFAGFRQTRWYHYGVLGLEQTQLCVRSPYLDNDLVRAVYRAPKGQHTDDVRPRLIGDGNPALAEIRSDRSFGGNAGPLRAAILRHSLEFAAKAEYAYDYGMPQWVARADHVFSWFHVDRLFLGRHKFLHYRIWYQTALAEYVRQILLDARTLSRPYLKPKIVEAVVRQHLNGERNYTMEIHKLLTLELLQRQLLDPR